VREEIGCHQKSPSDILKSRKRSEEIQVYQNTYVEEDSKFCVIEREKYREVDGASESKIRSNWYDGLFGNIIFI